MKLPFSVLLILALFALSGCSISYTEDIRCGSFHADPAYVYKWDAATWVVLTPDGTKTMLDSGKCIVVPSARPALHVKRPK